VQILDRRPSDASGKARRGTVRFFRGYTGSGDPDGADGRDGRGVGEQRIAIESLGRGSGRESEDHGGEGAHGAAASRALRAGVKTDTVDAVQSL